MNYWFKSSFFILSSRLIRSLSGIATLFMLVRILDINEFGVWILFLTVNNLIEPFFRGLINNAGIKFIGGNKDNSRVKVKVQSSIIELILLTFIATVILVFSASGFLASFFEAAELQQMLNINLAFIFFLLVRLLLESLGQANLDFKGITLAVLVNRVLFVSAVGWAFFFYPSLSLIDLVYIRIVNSGITMIISFIFYGKYSSRSFVHNRYWLNKIFNYAKFNIASDFSSILFKNTDKLMLGKLNNPLGVALYDTALRVANFSEIPIRTVAVAAFPKMIKTIKEEGMLKGKSLYEKSVGSLLSVTIPIALGVILFSKWIILFIAGDKYLGSVEILNITMLYGLLIPFNRFYGVFMNAAGMPQKNLINTVIILSANIVSNYFFILEFGPVGAAYGTLLGYFVGVFTGQVILNRYIKVSYLRIADHSIKFYPKLINKLFKMIKL